MADWLNGNLNRLEGVVRVDREKNESLEDTLKRMYKTGLIPKNAVVTATEQNNKNYRFKYVLTNTLTPERIIELNKNVPSLKLNNKKPTKKAKATSVMALFNIADFHLNRKVWGKSGYGDDYDIPLARKVFCKTVDEAVDLLKSSRYNIEKIVLNTAGDFLNSDTINATTTAGTPQDNDVSWQEAFLVAQELLTYALARLSEVAPVYTQYVAGNHDQATGWYLTNWLKTRFNGVKNVHVSDMPNIREVVIYGTNVIVLSHGDIDFKNAKDLPFIESEARALCGEATNIEVITGHMHKGTVVGNENTGVRWEILPTACPVGDQWTYDKGYANKRCEASIFYYDKHNRVSQDTINTKKFV